MNRLHLWVGGLVVFAWGMLATAAPAQDVRPAVEDRDADVHRLVIYNGADRTVHYYGKDLTADERASLQDLEQAQQDVAEARAEQSRPARRTVAVSTTAAPILGLGSPYYYPPLLAGDLYGRYLSNLNYILSDSMPAIPATLPYYGWGYSYYNPAPLAVATGPQVLALGGTQMMTVSTDAEEADRPRMSLTEAEQRERTALARVNRSARLRTALNQGRKDTKAVAHEEEHPPQVTVTLKNGKTVTGRLVRQDKNWMYLDTGKQEIQIRTNETVSIARDKAGER